MPHYRPPVEDMRFLLREVHDCDRVVATLPGFEDVTVDTVLAVLDSAGKFASEVPLPINLPGDLAALETGVGSESPRFYRGKLKTAGFFMTHLLPETSYLSLTMQAGSHAIIGVDPEEL